MISTGLVVITDGCIGVHDAAMFESILTQLRTSTIACTFIRIGEDRSHSGHFGHIPHTELMQFIATATFGSYFDSCPDVVCQFSLYYYRLNQCRLKQLWSAGNAFLLFWFCFNAQILSWEFVVFLFANLEKYFWYLPILHYLLQKN